jgi:leucyl-tRNA synthetase
MTEVNFAKIEKKWQEKWEKERAFEVTENKKPKFYVLEMFPYPSGSGLHMGHAWNYSITDIFARFKRMGGFNVLYPAGYDALGLPAENAAISAKEHPEEYTQKSIKHFIKQQKNLGLSYDWSRVINTADPEYYRWDQWIFLKMFEKGLVYQKEAAVNWCPKCNTILANEQVHEGMCWRHEDTEVEVRQMNQWFLKITDYADRLLEGHKKLNWPEKTIAMQKNWIGKSSGTEIDFEINNPDEKISNVVIVHGSPSKNQKEMNPNTRTYDKHWIPWLKDELEKRKINAYTPLMPEPWEPNYENWKKEFEKININENSILIGHSAGTTFLVRYLSETKKKIKKLILVAPWNIPWKEAKSSNKFCDYQINKDIRKNVKEVVFFTSDNEESDGRKSLEIFKKEIGGKVIELKSYGHFCERDMGKKEFPELVNEINNEKWKVFTTRPDTIFGVTFMVVSAQHPRLMELVTKEQKKKVDEFLKKIKTVSQKSMKDVDELNKEGVFTGSYAVNPATNEKVPVYAGNFVVADYGSGMVMAVPAHDQRDFEFAKEYGVGIKQVIDGKLDNRAYTDSGKLVNSSEFNGLDNETAKEQITKWLISKRAARKTINYKLRDWSVARQRYWGTPIPLIHCEKCGVVPVPEKDLPVRLPKEVKFGEGNPLLTNKGWLNVKCPACGGKAQREANTMDTFVNSSWYFLRYCDPHNKKEIFDKKKVKYWMPIDLYIGGAEHACMHLIYCRFYTMFLHDIGLVDFDEPAPRLFHQGMLRAEGGEKMSKSKGNVVVPEVVSGKYGIDTARFFLCSLAAPDKDIDWDENGIQGSLRFVRKIYSIYKTAKIGKDSAEISDKINKAIKNIGEQIENLEYRKSTIELRELFDLISKQREVSRVTLENGLKLLAPICPHTAEELWEKIGNKGFVSLEKWPEYKEIRERKEKKDINQNIINYVSEVIKKVEGKQKIEKVFIYVMPFEIKDIDANKISKALGKETKIFAVNDPEKYDPENKAKKALPGKPGVYLE